MKIFEIEAKIPVRHDNDGYQWNEDDQKKEAYVFKLANILIRYARQDLDRQSRNQFIAETEIILNEKDETTFTILGKLNQKSPTNQQSILKDIDETVCNKLMVIYSVNEVFEKILDIDHVDPHKIKLVQPAMPHHNTYIEIQSENLIAVANLLRSITGNSVRPLKIRVPGHDWILLDATSVTPNPVPFKDDSRKHTFYGKAIGIDDDDFYIKFLPEPNQSETKKFIAHWENNTWLGLQLSTAYSKKSIIKISGYYEIKMVAGESKPMSFWIQSMEIVEEGLAIHLNEEEP